MAPADGPLADIRIRAPTRGNRRLDQLLEAVNGDLQVKAWWHMAGVNAQRLGLTDHSWVHIQIVTNIALRLGAAALPPRHHDRRWWSTTA